MSKLALCINRADAPDEFKNATSLQLLPLPSSFFNTPSKLIDRAVCETDENTLQFIPYIILMNSECKIFCYSRGGAGNESRLHGQLSVGLGGHVDIAPEPDGDLFSLLHAEAERELQEEAGIVVGARRMNFSGLLVDPTNPVGRVHIGLYSVFIINQEDRLTLEPGMIEKGEWLPIEALTYPSVYDRLENWSKASVAHLAQQFNNADSVDTSTVQ